MKNISDIPENTALFEGIGREELDRLLPCLGARQRSYQKDAYIYAEAEPVTAAGVVLEGSAMIIREDYWGRRSILAKLGRGEMFGEAFACAGAQKLSVSVVASEKTRILFVDCVRIAASCPSACAFHSRLIRNLLRIQAARSLMLTDKLEHMTKRTTREKLLSYLSSRAREAGSDSFTIPFNRQELADYLSVDRSAMSAELGRMRDQGLLTMHKNQFCLKGGITHV